MSNTERVRLLDDDVNKIIEVPLGSATVEHEGRLFQRTGFGHSVASDESIPSFHRVEDQN